MKCRVLAGRLGVVFDLHAVDRSAKLSIGSPEFLPPPLKCGAR